jgi:hypothetical protein
MRLLTPLVINVSNPPHRIIEVARWAATGKAGIAAVIAAIANQ